MCKCQLSTARRGSATNTGWSQSPTRTIPLASGSLRPPSQHAPRPVRVLFLKRVRLQRAVPVVCMREPTARRRRRRPRCSAPRRCFLLHSSPSDARGAQRRLTPRFASTHLWRKQRLAWMSLTPLRVMRFHEGVPRTLSAMTASHAPRTRASTLPVVTPPSRHAAVRGRPATCGSGAKPGGSAGAMLTARTRTPAPWGSTATRPRASA